MPAEAWVALGIGLAGIAGSVLVGVWVISSQFSKAITRFELSVGVIDQRLVSLERSNEAQNLEIKKLGEILVTLGRYEERFLRLEGQIDELRHGRGMIVNGNR